MQQITGKITFEKVVELCSANPAKIFGCTDKGSLSIGKDADIVIYDKDKDFTISVSNMHSDCDHTIWEGKKIAWLSDTDIPQKENLCTITVNLSEHRVWDNILSVNQENNRNCRYMCKT